MWNYDLTLIGFGNVNRALTQLITTSSADLARDYGISLRVIAIADMYQGSIVNLDGIDLAAVDALKVVQGGFAKLLGGSVDANVERIINEVPADFVVEATFTNAVDGQPTVSYCRRALTAGRHVVTTNKGPMAFAADELKHLALSHGVALGYEGTVMSGTPVLRIGREALPAAGLTGFQGILNGTSNFVLGRMEDGATLEEAVMEAQSLGFAEADPTADLAGYDVRLKVVILANDLLGASLRPEDISCSGIQALTLDDICTAAETGERWKLVGEAHREGAQIVASVSAKAFPLAHPLATVSGATNAVIFDTQVLGQITVSGAGAGRIETAYALLADIIEIHLNSGAVGNLAT